MRRTEDRYVKRALTISLPRVCLHFYDGQSLEMAEEPKGWGWELVTLPADAESTLRGKAESYVTQGGSSQRRSLAASSLRIALGRKGARSVICAPQTSAKMIIDMYRPPTPLILSLSNAATSFFFFSLIHPGELSLTECLGSSSLGGERILSNKNDCSEGIL